MTCPRCQQDNPPHARFCLGCGGRLALPCAACGAELPAGARFCLQCGHAVPAGPAPARAPAPETYTPKHLAEKILTSRAALEGERKQVTVLFADLKGSMELLADRDPEEARKLLDPVLELMMEAVHRYEGTVNQVMGDGIMALFGAPLAHEDHAVRACYAALRMQESVARYADGVFRAHGMPIQIRVGLNSGAVVVRAIGSDLHMDYTALGQTTHLAARMEQMAAPGTILLAPATLQLAEGFVQVAARGPVAVKGLPDPVDVYALTGASGVRSRLHAAAVRGLTRFVGRDAEIELLRRALALALEGHGQLVALVGEPGVGKSRLVYEFTHSHRTQEWLVLEAGSVSYGKATSYLPVIDLLKGYFKIHDRESHGEIREKVTGKLLSLDRALEPALAPLLSLLEVPAEDEAWGRLDPPQRRQQILDAVKRLLLRESQVQPLLLSVEDLHWIDGETQALLDSLVQSLPTARVLLLASYRPEYRHGWGSKTYYRQLRVDPLPAESADDLLTGMLGSDPSLDALKRALIERTDGNPFFLEESVRALAEIKGLVGEPGAYRPGQGATTIEMPATVQAIVATRIDRLAPAAKRLLQAAAVIGKDVPMPLLLATADAPEHEVRVELTHLQAAEFLYQVRIFPDLAYTFKHALTHEVAYGGLLHDRRRALHARITEAIEQLYGDRLAEHVEKLAYHGARGELWEKTARYAHEAGIKAIDRSAHVEALGHAGQGIEALQHLPATAERSRYELKLQITRGLALIATRGYAAPEVEQAYARARALCEEAGEPAQLLLVLRGLGTFYMNRAQLEAARGLIEQRLDLAQQLNDRTAVWVAQSGLAMVLYHMGEFPSAMGHLERALASADVSTARERAAGYGIYTGQWTIVGCLAHAAWALWFLGAIDESLVRSDEALTLAGEFGQPLHLANARYWAAQLSQYRRDRVRTRELAEAVITASAKEGFAQQKAQGMFLRGWAMAEPGAGGQGWAQMREGFAAWEATGAGVLRPYYLALLAEVAAQAGDVAEGLRLIDEALATVEKSGERSWQAEVHRLHGELLLQQAGSDATTSSAAQVAEVCFRQALAVARDQQARCLELRAAMSLGRQWHRLGQRQRGTEVLAPICGWFADSIDTVDLREARALLAAWA
jgi:class 3 adenylate cyclase/predicted ATPase